MKVTAKDVARIRRQCLQIAHGPVELVMEGEELVAYVHDNTRSQPVKCYIGWAGGADEETEVAVIPG